MFSLSCNYTNVERQIKKQIKKHFMNIMWLCFKIPLQFSGWRSVFRKGSNLTTDKKASSRLQECVAIIWQTASTANYWNFAPFLSSLSFYYLRKTPVTSLLQLVLLTTLVTGQGGHVLLQSTEIFDHVNGHVTTADHIQPAHPGSLIMTCTGHFSDT